MLPSLRPSPLPPCMPAATSVQAAHAASGMPAAAVPSASGGPDTLQPMPDGDGGPAHGPLLPAALAVAPLGTPGALSRPGNGQTRCAGLAAAFRQQAGQDIRTPPEAPCPPVVRDDATERLKTYIYMTGRG